MCTVSVVIPALNEEQAIAAVLSLVPEDVLAARGFAVEKVVVDNGSTDRTAAIAREHGAVVVQESRRGYGNAYQAGFSHATGDIIVTGDADMTYPFDELPALLDTFVRRDIDFMTTDRLSMLRPGVMSPMNQFGNWVLTKTMRVLFGWPFRDSQSGMWIFRRTIWPAVGATHEGMAFSQELKLEAYLKGYRCTEEPVTYRARVGKVKLNAFRDGYVNMMHLFRRFLVVLRTHTPRIYRITTEGQGA